MFLNQDIIYKIWSNNKTFPKASSVLYKYINDNWCMDLALVDKLASQNNGVKYLLVAVDFFRDLSEFKQ